MKKLTKTGEVSLARRLLKRVGNYEMRKTHHMNSWSIYKGRSLQFYLHFRNPVTGTRNWVGLLKIIELLRLTFKFDRPSWFNEKLSLEELDFYLSVDGF